MNCVSLCLCMCMMLACGASDIDAKTPTNTEDRWGIQLTATDVTPSGCTLVCRQEGGQPAGELFTGSRYWLEKEWNGAWLPVEERLDLERYAWTLEAQMILMGESIEWPVNWSWLYGELPPGHYRIGKEVSDWQVPRTFEDSNYYAYFEVTASP